MLNINAAPSESGAIAKGISITEELAKVDAHYRELLAKERDGTQKILKAKLAC